MMFKLIRLQLPNRMIECSMLGGMNLNIYLPFLFQHEICSQSFRGIRSFERALDIENIAQIFSSRTLFVPECSFFPWWLRCIVAHCFRKFSIRVSVTLSVSGKLK